MDGGKREVAVRRVLLEAIAASTGGLAVAAPLTTTAVDDYEIMPPPPIEDLPTYDELASDSRTRGAAFVHARAAMNERDRRRIEREQQRRLAGRRP